MAVHQANYLLIGVGSDLKTKIECSLNILGEEFFTIKKFSRLIMINYKE